MKSNNSFIWIFIMMVIVAAVYRIIPTTGYGFPPHMALALFSGAVIKDKKWAFALPVFSVFLSDLLFEVLYHAGISNSIGFYEGQWQNYIIFALLTTIGFLIRKISVLKVLAGSLVAPTVYFILSNFAVWAGWQGIRGLNRPRTFEGLLMAYNDGIPFYVNSLYSTVVFSTVLFGAYYLFFYRKQRAETALAD